MVKVSDLVPNDEVELAKIRSRFLKIIKKVDNCWIWTGSKNKRGYGYSSIKHITIYAHRLSYELFVGSIPDNLSIDHLCKNPSCVNPDHLEAVTMKENLMRGDTAASINSKKTYCNKGHEYTKENTYIISKTGNRRCIICNKIRSKEYDKKYPDKAKARWKRFKIKQKMINKK